MAVGSALRGAAEAEALRWVLPSVPNRGTMAVLESRPHHVPGLKYFVCVVVYSACQDIHEQQSHAGELTKYYMCMCLKQRNKEHWKSSR